MSLETFLNRVEKYQEKRVKVLKKEIEEFGEIVFTRPPENVLISYLVELAQEVDTDIPNSKQTPQADQNIKVKDVPLKTLVKESSKLIYLSCIELRSKELRGRFASNIENYDIPLELFGMNTVLELGSFISDGFGATKAKEQVEENIKN